MNLTNRCSDDPASHAAMHASTEQGEGQPENQQPPPTVTKNTRTVATNDTPSTPELGVYGPIILSAP